MAMSMSRRLGAAVLTAAIAACAPTVNVETREPIVIQLNIQHELRVKIERDVGEMIQGDEAREQMGSRGLDEDVSASIRDAREVSEAKAAGRVGERADGYLGIVTPGDPDLAELAERVNEQRRSDYREMADRYRTTLPVVESVAGEQRLAVAAPGEKVMTADGRWVETPAP